MAITIPSGYTHPSTHPASMITGLATVATTGAYSDLSGKPTLATVATSGKYSDLSDKPTIPNAYVHPNSGVTAGTYSTVTVNAQGHVTAGSNGSVVKTVNNISPDSNGNVELFTVGSTDLTVGSSSLADGQLYFVYE